MTDLPSAETKPVRKKNRKSAALASGVLLGIAAVFWFVFRDRLVRAVPVRTAQVVLLEHRDGTSETTKPGPAELMFQASGWVEPDPWKIDLAVKTSGFVEEVFVKEGEAVTNGQVVATLDPADVQLAAEAAESRMEAAQQKLAAAEARLSAKRDIWERFSKTGSNAISLSDRETAKQEFMAAEAEKLAARATLRTAVVQHDAAALALERTVIRAPMGGIVLRRYANPGDKRMTGADDPNSSVIVSLYDPDRLQVRVDVPIAEAGKMTVGQPTRISTALLAGRTFTGRVTRIVGQADLQRNTLQAKVEIDDPDPRLRPDVLCRVEFWKSSSVTQSGTVSTENRALWVPVGALQSDAQQQEVWVINPLTQTAHRRSIKLTATARDGLRQIAEGLRANEKVVVEPTQALKEGSRIKEANP